MASISRCITSMLLFLLLFSCATVDDSPPPFALVIHGGAGSGTRADIGLEREKSMRAALHAALASGYAVLEQGGNSLDAVQAAILVLEDDPNLNAGKGAVFNAAGGHELDASIMDGKTLKAGAVAGVTTIRNPILLARAVMEQSPHVMMAGDGAVRFARQLGLEEVDPTYFDTEHRRKALERALQKQSETGRDAHSGYFGTVGVVALDKQGNLAAGTSTGGMTAKRFGRVGDSPVIGAGTYANNASCGVSSTGHGEFFIRHVVAFNICAKMQYQNLSIEQAADAVVMDELVKAGGTGGVIAMDAKGNIAWPFNTKSMLRAYQSGDSGPVVKIFKDE